MEEKITKLITIVKSELNYDYTTTHDNEIKGYLSDFISKIKSICNRVDLPIELEYMAVKYAKNCMMFYKDGYGESKKVVTSISDNGQSIGYKEVGAITSNDVNVDKVVEKNIDEISKYTYVRW